MIRIGKEKNPKSDSKSDLPKTIITITESKVGAVFVSVYVAEIKFLCLSLQKKQMKIKG